MIIKDKVKLNPGSAIVVLYGFSNGLKELFKMKISLSKLTFSHDMARLFFCEQLYRALTIVNNIPYHNE